MPLLHTRQEGQGPTVVLSHALGCDLSMWDEVAALLAPDHTVLRYDHPGHGQSGGQASDIHAMADATAALLRELGQGPVHFVGLSMGGMVAQSLAARHPSLLRSITIANSAAWYDAPSRALWDARVQTVQALGMASITEGALQRWFTPEFRQDPLRGEARVNSLRPVLLDCDPQAYAASCQAVAGIDFRASNPQVRCPTLVIAGTRDEATPVALSEAIAQAIPGARLASLEAAHLSAVEQPEAFAQALRAFWASL